MLILELKAPFAACRPMIAGWYRPTSPVLTHSAAYGLLLNVACVETRMREDEAGHPGRVPASLMRDGLPKLRLAIGLPEGVPPPRVQSVYQQLHNYPVGRDAGIPAEWARGTKNNITPSRREFLSDLDVILCADGNEELEERIRSGLAGEFNGERYGLPFVGDNSFLIDRLDERVAGDVPPCRWYEQLGTEAHADRVPETARLTTWIDRADMTRTRSALFAPTMEATVEIPEQAWQWIPPDEPESS